MLEYLANPTEIPFRVKRTTLGMLEYLQDASRALQVPYPRPRFRQEHGRYRIDPVTQQVKVVAGLHPRWKDPKPLATQAIALRGYRVVWEKFDHVTEMTAVLRSDGLEYQTNGIKRGSRVPIRRYLGK